MKPYIVLYRVEAIMSPVDNPFSFHCMAENLDHAEEQLINSDPDANIVWVAETNDPDVAYKDWIG